MPDMILFYAAVFHKMLFPKPSFEVQTAWGQAELEGDSP